MEIKVGMSVMKSMLEDPLADDSYEPKRMFRWVLKDSGIEPFLVSALRCLRMPSGGMAIEVDYHAFQATDLTARPLKAPATACLMFLDDAGKIVDSYRISWYAVQYVPFVELNYKFKDALLQRALLLDASMVREGVVK